MKTFQSHQKEDALDVSGIYIVDKLRRKINTDKVKFAERLVSEDLFEVDMGLLNQNCKIEEVG